MKKSKLNYSLSKVMACSVSVLVTAASFFACDSDRQGSGRLGQLRLTLATDTTSLKKGVSSPTRAVSDEFAQFLETSDYKVRIVQGEDTVQAFERYDEMPSEIELKEGVYTLVAYKGSNLPAAFENPYFEGSTDFTVKADMSTPIDVTCTLGNTRVTVDYTEDFKEAYADYTTLLSSPFTTGNLEIKKGELRPAYMQVSKDGSELGIAIRLKKVGETAEKTYTIPAALSIERRQNVHLIFKTDGEALQGIGLDVVLDDEMTNVTLSEGIPDFMWQQFTKPTLRSESFGSGEFTIKPGKLTTEPSVGFQVPAGIGGFFIDTWKEDNENDADTIRYNLALADDADGVLGVVSAIQAGYRWNLNQNGVLSNARGSGQLYLQTAVNNLSGPLNETDDAYVYHIRIYACDNLPKVNYTDKLELKVIVSAAGAPEIIFPSEFPSVVVEGDMMDKDTTIVISAENGIDKENTSLSINDKKYVFASQADRNELNTLGVEYKEVNNKQVNLIFHPSFSGKLTAPDAGASSNYTYRIDLQEEGQYKRKVSQSRTLEVKAPEIVLASTNGDAFAKRIVLRADMPVGHKEKLEFQYRKTGESAWTYVTSAGLLQDIASLQCVDTLKNLTNNSRYDIRAIYNKNEKRTAVVTDLLTETPGTLPNAQFENWSIKADQNGSTAEGATNAITVVGSTQSPYRYWEVWQPWTSGNEGWNTLNFRTTQYGQTKDGLVSATTVIDGGFPWTRYRANSGTIRTVGVDGGYAALIRTVGWGKGNSAVGEGSAAIINSISAGELYLGTCTGLDPNYGMTFFSRPTGFSFQYKYLTKNGSDTFVAEIVVVASDGTIIATSQSPNSQSGAVSDWTTSQVRLNYKGDSGKKKASKMYIRLKSSSSNEYDFLRENLMVWPGLANLSNGEYVGSQLYIDNVELFYE